MISGRQFVLPAVPWADDGPIDDSASSQGSPLMHADSIDGIEGIGVTIDRENFSPKNDLDGFAFWEFV